MNIVNIFIIFQLFTYLDAMFYILQVELFSFYPIKLTFCNIHQVLSVR